MEPNNMAAPPAAARQRGRTALTLAAVLCAALGLASLTAVLVGAWLGEPVWRGFVAGAFILLPLGFILMVALVLGAVVLRRRS
ncbi:hypothetical protein ACX80W_13835 [Arthrobacter sp. TMN-37]